jgi:hypothetical protein
MDSSPPGGVLGGRDRVPFVLFSPERTGSTTLVRLLNCHPAIRCIREPFNPQYTGPVMQRCQELRKTTGLEAAVASLWQVCNGLKHVWHADGWPFAGGPALNRRLLVTGTAAIILLWRRNLLQRAISGQISMQMGVWVPGMEEERRRIREHQFQPLDIPRLRAEIAAERAERQHVGQLAVACGKPWIEVCYEDFLAPNLPLEARREAVQRLFDFLQVGRLTHEAVLAQMDLLFDPSVTGFQNAAAYHKIPNIAQVEQELGSPENGFVFERPRSPASF